MPLITLLLGALGRLLFWAVGRVALWLGFSAITYVGASAVLSQLQTLLQGQLNGLPAAAIQVIGLMRIDLGLSLLLSGYAFQLAARGLTAAGGMGRVIKRRV